MRPAERRGRIPRGRGIYMTEFGFQTNPPDRRAGLSLAGTPRSINEADRLFFGDPRVRAVAQFTLFDAPEPPRRTSTTPACGSTDGTPKPAWGAYRMPLVVTAPGAAAGWRSGARCARREGPVAPQVQVLARRRRWVTIATPRTNASGYFRFKRRRRDAARRAGGSSGERAVGEVMRSRIASAGPTGSATSNERRSATSLDAPPPGRCVVAALLARRRPPPRPSPTAP